MKFINSISSDSILIGEHYYPYIQIGNQLWMAKNLAEDVYGSYWYNNNPKYSYCGKLYNFTRSKDALSNIIPAGWRIPTYNDISTLINNCGTDWHKYALNFSNEYGFNAITTGYANYKEEYVKINDVFCFWSSTIKMNTSQSKTNWTFAFNESTNFCGLDDFNFEHSQCAIRLVKDI